MTNEVSTTLPGNITTAATAQANAEPITIDLRDPWVAAFLAWLVPGLGHLYQRRYGKGGLFMVCILGTFFYGLWLGGGRVVYASFRPGDGRYAFVCQVGAGLVAMPAVVQAIRTGEPNPKAPLFGGLMAPPMLPAQRVPRAWIHAQQERFPKDPEFAPDRFKNIPNDVEQRYYIFQPARDQHDKVDQLADWHKKLGGDFDLGTVYTMIAGLLNLLVIWDAWGGPFVPAPVEAKDAKEKKK